MSRRMLKQARNPIRWELAQTGYLNYSSDGRMMVILVGDNRKAPAGPVATDAEMITLFKSMMAYAGTYTT